MGLLPFKALEKIGLVMTHGAEKYGANSWQDLPDFEERYKDALSRHYNDYMQGKLIDEDSGLSMLSLIATNALFLLEKEEISIEMKNNENI